MNDNVNHPVHYTQGSIECIDALKAATVGKKGIEAVCVANVIKYLWRYEEKNGLEDTHKAQWYLNHLIQELEKNNASTTAIQQTTDCSDCLYCDYEVTDVPCVNCKNNYLYSTKEYKNYPLNFQPKT